MRRAVAGALAMFLQASPHEATPERGSQTLVPVSSVA